MCLDEKLGFGLDVIGTPILIGHNSEKVFMHFFFRIGCKVFEQIGMYKEDIGLFVNLKVIYKKLPVEELRFGSYKKNYIPKDRDEWFLKLIDLFVIHEVLHYIGDCKHEEFYMNCTKIDDPFEKMDIYIWQDIMGLIKK